MQMTPAHLNIASANAEVLAHIRQMCLERFDFFCAAVLKYLVTPFHANMMDHIFRTPHSLVLAPRGSGKSTVGDVAYCLWNIVKNPNIRICIASKSGPQAQSFLGEIKAHIENNEDFKKLFGDIVGPTWNDNEIQVSTRTRILKEPTITAKSVGAGIPGFHFDLIIADDLVDPENSATEHQREKLKHWFYVVLLPTLEPDTGELRVIGTRYHPQDIYGHFAGKTVEKLDPEEIEAGKVPQEHYNDEMLGPHVWVLPALTVDPETGEEVSFWPEKFSVDFLQKKRRNGLLFFNLAYQNDAELKSGQIMHIEDLEPYVWTMKEHIPDYDDLAIFQGVDPAISQKQSADFFAHCTIGISRELHIYVLKIHKLKISFNRQVQFIVEEERRWGPEKIGIETVAYQQALAQAVAEHPWMPIHQVKPRKDKEQRARVFSAFVDRHEVHLHSSMYELMETLVRMPAVEHDDIFDALDIAVETAKTSILSDTVIARLPTNFRAR